MISRNSGIARSAALLVFVMLAAGWVSAAEAAVAMITDLQGKAVIADAGKSREATILAELEAGAQVQLNSGATLVVLYLDAGDEYVFKGPAQVVFKSGQPEVVKGAQPEKRVTSLGTRGKDIRIKPVGMAQGAIVMRSARPAARIRLLSLSGTRTLEIQPEFRWQEAQPGIKYQFEINDDIGRTFYEAQVATTSFKLPSNVQLKDGMPYTWEVSARLADGRKYSSAGDFSMASAALRAQADALRPAASAPLSSRVAYAAWLDQMELKDEARKYWRALATERPEDVRLKALAAD